MPGYCQLNVDCKFLHINTVTKNAIIPFKMTCLRFDKCSTYIPETIAISQPRNRSCFIFFFVLLFIIFIILLDTILALLQTFFYMLIELLISCTTSCLLQTVKCRFAQQVEQHIYLAMVRQPFSQYADLTTVLEYAGPKWFDQALFWLRSKIKSC